MQKNRIITEFFCILTPKVDYSPKREAFLLLVFLSYDDERHKQTRQCVNQQQPQHNALAGDDDAYAVLQKQTVAYTENQRNRQGKINAPRPQCFDDVGPVAVVQTHSGDVHFHAIMMVIANLVFIVVFRQSFLHDEEEIQSKNK